MSRYRFPWAQPTLHGREEEFVVDAIRSTWLSGGAYVDRLESETAQLLGGAHQTVSVNNGTAALQLALLTLDIGPGDDVIVPDFSFVAAASMVLAVGARPVFADVDADTWLLDPRSVESLMSSRTRAVLAVHLFGNVCAMPELAAVAEHHGVALIEDCAEAFMSRCSGQVVGTFGDVGTFSFQATKTIASGEGGLISIRDVSLADRARVLRDHGMATGRRYWHELPGFNFRLTNLQAAVACAQLLELEAIVATRKRIHGEYVDHLSAHDVIRFQAVEESTDLVPWAMPIRLGDDGSWWAAEKRDALIAAVGRRGVETRPGFYPATSMPPYAGDSAATPNSAAVAASVISLPMYLELTTEEIGLISESFVDSIDEVSA